MIFRLQTIAKGSQVRRGRGPVRTKSAAGIVASSIAIIVFGTACTSSGSKAKTTSPGLTGEAPGYVPVAQTVRLGQSFEIQYDNEGTEKWRLALTQIRCGGPDIFDRQILAKGNADVPDADPGTQFCLVRFDVTNEGHRNLAVWSADRVSVNVGVHAYSDDGLGAGYGAGATYQMYAEPSVKDSSFGLNRGVKGVSWAVHEIPAGATATSVSVPIGTSLKEFGSGVQQVLIKLGA